MRGLFVTGTGTGVGKTLVTLGLMQSLQARGLRVAAMKPVATGAVPTPAGLRNDDALRLQRYSSGLPAYGLVNPFVFEPAVAPHLAAEQAGQRIDFDRIQEACRELARHADVVLVEGVGGWRVPLDGRRDVAALAVALGLPVCLVVGLELGCLNHALLTRDAMAADGCKPAGWVANHLPAGIAMGDGNVNTLKKLLSFPLLGEIPVLAAADAGKLAQYLDVARLREYLSDLLN